ncbi:LPS-assembly protein LptD [Thermoproteota archaeon]
MIFFKKLFAFILLAIVCCPGLSYAQDSESPTSVIVNGDNVEFFHDQEKVVAEGNVIVEYGTSTLKCDKLVVFTKTKDAFAEGNVRFDDGVQVAKGSSFFYNFDTKKGKLIDSDLKADPYFCVSPESERVGDKFILYDANLTTCNYDNPHYYLHAKRAEIIPNDNLRAWDVTFIAGKIPVMFLPFFSQDLDDKRYGFSVTPGHSKEWGEFLLTDWTFWLTDSIRAALRFDYRTLKGFAKGLDLESYSNDFGDSNLQYYAVREKLTGDGEVRPYFKDPDRYKIEYKHDWHIDDKTHLVAQMHKYSDANFLKNYFEEQYEKVSQPSSFALLSRSFSGATVSMLWQKQFNHFYSVTQRLPEVKVDVSKQKIFDTPFYFESGSSVTNFNTKTALTQEDEDVVRVDSYNQVSYPFKLAFINLEPFAGYRNTYYSKDKNGSEDLWRKTFYTGSSALTKFYRTYPEIKIDSYGLEIDKLRHIITPSFDYSYIHSPTLPSSRLTAFDSIDSIVRSHSISFSLENKLQTKREGINLDFLKFMTSIPYSFMNGEPGMEFGTLSLDLEAFPNSWLVLKSDASINIHRERYGVFDSFNFSTDFPWGDKGRVTTEYRYSRASPSKLITLTVEKYLNPKWRIRTYHRFELEATDYIEEQEYAIARDLHCWEVEFSLSNRKKKGVIFYLTFRCKAFPNLGTDISRGHQQPKT